ncbi:MAG: DUF2147 domain-containing protein [Bacteroidota bacterium]
MKKTLFPIVALLCILNYSYGQGDAILGEYWTESKEGRIEIYREGNAYFGRIKWRKEVINDTKNPDPKLRNKSVIDLIFLKDFMFRNNKWVGGTVYSIDNGNTYSGKLWLENSGRILKMRGYLGFSLLGRTATLTRVD